LKTDVVVPAAERQPFALESGSINLKLLKPLRSQLFLVCYRSEPPTVVATLTSGQVTAPRLRDSPLVAHDELALRRRCALRGASTGALNPTARKIFRNLSRHGYGKKPCTRLR